MDSYDKKSILPAPESAMPVFMCVPLSSNASMSLSKISQDQTIPKHNEVVSSFGHFARDQTSAVSYCFQVS